MSGATKRILLNTTYLSVPICTLLYLPTLIFVNTVYLLLLHYCEGYCLFTSIAIAFYITAAKATAKATAEAARRIDRLLERERGREREGEKIISKKIERQTDKQTNKQTRQVC